MNPQISVVVPVYNAAPYLARCLGAIRRLDPAPLECLVVDDGSEDGSVAIAEAAGFSVLAYGCHRGAAFARNFGARVARGEILLFIDADVEVPSGTAGRVVDRFEEDPTRDAVIGSYDDRPADPGFISQYRNLLHCYTHQQGRAEASTFWTGCGAIRARAFRLLLGFSPARRYLEDLEFGLRLAREGRRIWLDKGLMVKHLKRLSFVQVLRTDLFERAFPWTLLILKYRSMPPDLNLRWGQRISVLFAGAAGAAALAGQWAAAFAAVGVVAALNFDFYRFLAARAGLRFAVCCVPVHLIEFLDSGAGFAAGIVAHGFRAVLREDPAPERLIESPAAALSGPTADRSGH